MSARAAGTGPASAATALIEVRGLTVARNSQACYDLTYKAEDPDHNVLSLRWFAEPYDADSLFVGLRRVLPLMEHRVDVIALANDILHWGDNRPNPPERVWTALGRVDVALLPIDGSEHVMSSAQLETVIGRLAPRIVVPHHYHIWDVTTRGSTLLPADAWVKTRANARWAQSGSVELVAEDVRSSPSGVLYFGEHVAFQKPSTKGNEVGA